MSPEAIRDALNRKPFVPFHIRLSDGRSFLITRPELVFLGGALTIIGIVRNIDSVFFDEPVTIANRHIVSLEPALESVVS